jgi:hypothetical protein
MNRFTLAFCAESHLFVADAVAQLVRVVLQSVLGLNLLLCRLILRLVLLSILSCLNTRILMTRPCVVTARVNDMDVCWLTNKLLVAMACLF